ncbi:MAG: glycosyltransferase [Myxococcota bacterium]
MVPGVAHFVWYGAKLPYLHALAIRSAATHGGFEAVKLHHADPLEEFPHVKALEALPNFDFVPLDDQSLSEEVSGPSLVDLVRSLKSPVARANVARAAIVFRDGGVYLDMDTLTIRSFDGVRAKAAGFIGRERIVFPGHVVRSRDPRVKAKAYLMTALRDLYRRAPHGYRAFRRIEPHYHLAVNNALLGGESGHPVWRALLDAMATLPRERWQVRYALGTHLSQSVCEAYRGGDFHLFSPPVFYPLPPEISAHWFRHYPRGANGLDAIDDMTCCIHWYASVRTKKVVASMTDADAVRRLASTQLFSSLAVRVLDGEPIAPTPAATPD